MSGKDEGWFRSQLCSLDQRVILIPRPDISVVGNGISCARSETVPSRCFGSQTAPRDFAVGKHGDGKLPTNLSSMTLRTELTPEKRGSNHG